MRRETLLFVITLQDVSATFFNYRKSKSFCNPLPDPRYGYVECNNRDYSGNYNIGTRCTFHCDENYELEGTSKTSCNKKGDWTSRQIPECVRNDSKLVAAEPPTDVRLDEVADSLESFMAPKDSSPTGDELDGMKISSDVMVSFLEFILENPQTNSLHAFKAFQRGDLQPQPKIDGTSDFEFEEIETPDVEYEDEYESSFYANFDEDEFYQQNWDTSWDDNWTEEDQTTSTIATVKTTAITTTQTQHPLIMQPEIFVDTVGSDTFSLQWLAVTNAFTYEVSLYDVDSNTVSSTHMTLDSYYQFKDVQPETTYKVSVQAVSSTGYRSAASIFTLKTTPVPPKVTVSNISPTQVRINWQRLISALSYVVTVNDLNGVTVFNHFAFPSYDSMDVPFLTPESDYIITVDAILIDDVQVSTTIRHQTMRPSPIHVKVLDSTDTEIVLEWAPSVGIIYYEIITSDQNNQVDAQRIENTDTSYHIRYLEPYKNYHLHLRAFYTDDIYTESQATVRTKSIPPVVEVTAVTDISASIRWSRVPGAVNYKINLYSGSVLIQSDDIDVKILEYKLNNLSHYTPHTVEIVSQLQDAAIALSGEARFKTDPASPQITIIDISAVGVKFDWTSVPDTSVYRVSLQSSSAGTVEHELSPTTTSFQFENLDYWTPYTITVAAKHQFKTFIGSTAFRTLSIAPTVRVDETTAQSFSISWTSIPGVTGGYSVDIDGVVHPVVDSAYDAFNLEPYTKYLVTVLGRTSNGGVYSTVIEVLTDPEPPALELASIDSSSGMIEWAKVPDSTGYTTRIFDSSGSLFESIRSHHINKFEFNGFSPYQHYIIEVTARYGEKMLTSQMDVLTDPEPPKINVKYIGTTYLSAWWPSVPGTESYEVELSHGAVIIVIETIAPGNVLNWSGADLLPDTAYVLTVKAKQPEKDFISQLEMKTSPIPSLSQLRVTRIFSSSVTLEWERSPNWNLLSSPQIVVPQHLQLIYYKNIDDKQEMELSISDSSVTVENLEPDWNYTLELRAIYSFGLSDPSTASCVTAPIMQNVHVTNVATTSARLNWNHLPNADAYYINVLPELIGHQNPIQIFNNLFDLTDLEKESTFEITIHATLPDATTDTVTGLNFTTSPAPPSLVIDDITSTSMKLGSPAFDAEIILHGHEVMKTLDDLEPATDYTFKLRAVFDNAVTDWAAATYTTAPVGADLWFDHVRSTSLNVHWIPIDDALQYSLTVTPDVGEMLLAKDAQSAIVEGLNPSVAYKFSWVAIFDFARTDATEATQSTAPPSPQVTFDAVQSTTFQLAWNDEDYCKDYNLNFIPAAEERIRNKRNSHRIVNLKANTEYQAIVSCNVAYGITDDSIETIRTAVSPPLLSVHDVRSSSARITWTTRAEYSRYTLLLDSNLFAEHGSTFELSHGRDAISFDSLDPATSYTVTLNTFTTNGETDSVEITFLTAPTTPMMTFESIMSSEATLVWNTHDRIEYYQISFDPEIGIIPSKVLGNRLPLTNLPSLTSYSVTIVGVGDGFITDSKTTEFQTAPASPDVFISNVSTSQFTISWASVPQASTVEIEIFPYPENVPAGIVILPETDSQYTLTFLQPSTRYYIKLSCIINGRTRTNIVDRSQITAPEAPIVYAQNITSTRMDIEWSVVQDVAHYVLNIYPLPPGIPQDYQLIETQISLSELENDTPYQIDVKAVLVNDAVTDSGFTHARSAPDPPKIIIHTVRSTIAKLFYTPVKDVKRYKITIDPPVAGSSDFSRTGTKLDLWSTRPDVTYTVTVQGILEHSITDPTSIVFESAPPAVVAQSKEKRTTSIRIDWNPVPGAHKYFASIWPATTSGIVRIPVYSNFVQLTDLVAETNYVMNITATSVYSTWTTDIHTCRFATGPAMSEIKSSDVSSTAMELTWPYVQGVEFYELSFSPPINDDGSPLIVYKNKTYVENLLPDTEYQISVCGKSDLFHTDAIHFAQFTAPPAPVLVFPRIKSRRLDLQWTQLPDDYFYIVDIRPKPIGYEHNLPMQTWSNTETITGMEPETMYHFMVKAVSEERGLVTDEFVISQTTAPLGPPVAVPNRTIRTTSAVIEWEEIPEAAMYHVSAVSKDSDAYDISHILQGLNATTYYSVSVLAVLMDTGVTDVTEIEFKTAPLPPTFDVVRARVQRDATVKLNCTWTHVKGKSMYYINMSPPHGTFRKEHNSSDYWMNVSGLQLAKTYMFGIFAELDSGKRTDVRSVTYRTPATPRCYQCSSVSRPEDCLEEVACPLMGGYSCMTFDRRENGRRMITRGCKKRDACEVQKKSHKCIGSRFRWVNCVMVGCCHDDLCNEGNRLN